MKFAVVENINCCNDCPNYDYIYYSYNEFCTILHKKTPPYDDIPEDCPLENMDELNNYVKIN